MASNLRVMGAGVAVSMTIMGPFSSRADKRPKESRASLQQVCSSEVSSRSSCSLAEASMAAYLTRLWISSQMIKSMPTRKLGSLFLDERILASAGVDEI